MTESNRCPHCAAVLPPDAPAGICPKCLLKAGMDDAVAGAPHDVTLDGGAALSLHDRDKHSNESGAADFGQIPPIGTTVSYFGDYELLDEIARGGMGVVYKARQVRLNRVVALKMILAGQFATEADIQRFHTEAEAAAQLDHPGIVPIFEVGEHEGHHYFSMALVEGRSLASHITDGPLPPKQAAELVRRVAEAVQYAHDKGVIHRDLKPANILIDQDGEPRVTDFGVAKRVKGDSNLTGTGQILGTPSYMPPEQAAGRISDIGKAVDVYSLGAVLYSTLTGRPPFQADNPLDTLMQVLEREPVAPRQLNASVPPDLETICLKCLEKDRRRRYTSVRELADELQRFMNNQPILARPINGSARVWRWCKRNRVVACLTVAVAVALIVGTIVSSYFAVDANYEAIQAQRNFEQAEQQRLRADRNADRARAEAARADAKAEDARRHLYIADMNIAQQAWESANLRRTLDLLNRHHPQPGEKDHRAFEWYYLWRQCRDATDGKTLWHSAAHCVAFSSDGSTVATGGADGAVKLWDVSSGEELARLVGPSELVSGVAFSPDGSTLAAGGFDRTIQLWDVTRGQLLNSLKGHSNWIFGVAISPDGTMLASCGQGGANNTVRLWDVASGALRTTLAYRGWVRGVAFSPDSMTLATAGVDHTVRLWHTGTANPIATLEGHTGEVWSVAFSPDGTKLVSGSRDRTIRLWDVDSHELVASFEGHTNFVQAIAFSPDGQSIASGSEDGTVRVWDVTASRPPVTFKGHSGEISAVSFVPGGGVLASASKDGSVKLWDLHEDHGTVLGQHAGIVRSVAFSPDGQTLASSSEDRTVKLWDVATGNTRHVLRGHIHWIWSVKFSPDRKTVVSGGQDETNGLKMWDASSGELLRTFPARLVRGMAISPDGRWIASAQLRGSAKLWDTLTGDVAALGSRDARVVAVAFANDSQTLATAGWDKKVRLWDVCSGELKTTLHGHTWTITSLAYSRDGARLASCGWDGTIRVWQLATGEHVALRGHTGSVASVAFDPRGERLASAGFDTTIKLWDLRYGEEVATLTGHTAPVYTLDFSPDGRMLASGSLDHSVRLWQTTNDTEPLDAVLTQADAFQAELEAITALEPLAAGARSKQDLVVAVQQHSTLLPAARNQARLLVDPYWKGAVLQRALRAVEAQFAKSPGSTEAADGLRADGALDEEVRHEALRLLPSYWKSLVHQRAWSEVNTLAERTLLNADLMKEIQDSDGIPEAIRAEAIRLARHWPEDAWGLNNASWRVVREEGAEADRISAALRWAERASSLEPDNGSYLNTLGVAQYRAGLYEEALATLTQSERLNAIDFDGAVLFDLAFLAMTYHRLGQAEQARATLDKLRAASRQPRWEQHEQITKFLREAESVLNEESSDEQRAATP